MNQRWEQIEWRLLRADRTMLITIQLFVLFFGYALWNGVSWRAMQESTLAGIRAEERERIAGLKEQMGQIEAGRARVTAHSDPRLPGVAGANAAALHAWMPPAPLAVFSIGQSDIYPYYYRVSTRSKTALLGSDEIENPLHLLNGRFDLGFAVVFLLPLFVIGLAYDVIAGERENGTLAMALANPVRIERLVWRKAAVRFQLMMGLVGLLAVAGTVVAGAGSGIWSGLLLWVAVVASYVLFWLGLAVWVNTWGRSAATNAVILSMFWLVFVLLVPLGANLAAEARYPVPSRVAMIQEMRAATNEANRQGAQLLAQYFEEHPDLVPEGGKIDPGDFMARFYAVQEAVERRMLPVLERYDEQLREQQALASRMRYLSPALLVQEALNEAAGTGASRYRDFEKQVDRYHAAWQRHFVPKVFQRAKLGPEDLDGLPRFEYVAERWQAAWVRGGGGVLVLLALFAAMAVLGRRGLRQYQVAG